MIFCLIISFLISSAAVAGNVTGKITGGHSNNMVVYIEGGESTTGSQSVEMDQKDKVFIPHVLAIQLGSQVCFKNSDNFGHNVHSLGPEKFNFAQMPTHKKCITFNSPGVYPIICDMHPEMSAYIYVANNAYYTMPDASGNFVIKNVPQGTYELKVWQPEGKETTQSIQVTPSGAKADINI